MIDGLFNKAEIVEMFSEKMQNLLNSTSNVGVQPEILHLFHVLSL